MGKPNSFMFCRMHDLKSAMMTNNGHISAVSLYMPDQLERFAMLHPEYSQNNALLAMSGMISMNEAEQRKKYAWQMNAFSNDLNNALNATINTGQEFFDIVNNNPPTDRSGIYVGAFCCIMCGKNDNVLRNAACSLLDRVLQMEEAGINVVNDLAIWTALACMIDFESWHDQMYGSPIVGDSPFSNKDQYGNPLQRQSAENVGQNAGRQDVTPAVYKSGKKRSVLLYIAIAAVIICFGIIIAINVRTSYFKEELPFYNIECGIDREEGRNILGNPNTSYVGELWGDYGYCDIDVYDCELAGCQGILTVYYNDEDEFVCAQWGNYSVDFAEYENERNSERDYPELKINEKSFDTIMKMRPGKLSNSYSKFTNSLGMNDFDHNTENITYTEYYDLKALEEGARYVKAIEVYQNKEDKDYFVEFFYKNNNEEDYIENYPCPWEE